MPVPGTTASLPMHSGPVLPGPFDVLLRAVEEKLERGAARETIAGAIIRTDPVQRTIGLDPLPRCDADGIIAIELGLHGPRRHDCLPDSTFHWRSMCHGPDTERQQARDDKIPKSHNGDYARSCGVYGSFRQLWRRRVVRTTNLRPSSPGTPLSNSHPGSSA